MAYGLKARSCHPLTGLLCVSNAFFSECNDMLKWKENSISQNAYDIISFLSKSIMVVGE